MSLDPTDGRRSVSPSLSSGGRSSPVPRASRRVEDGFQTKDKAVRRYAVGIDRALSSFDAAQQEWADYIAFLARLLKAIQLPPPNLEQLPHGSNVALRLSQCLNPALPSGVHQKALEVYSCILSILDKDVLGKSLHIYLPSLLPVPSFASLSVRPLYYAIFEDYIVKLNPADLRSTTKSLILCLLPGIEDDTSEDFERALQIIDSLRTASAQSTDGHAEPGTKDGYFWQCFFLAVITNPSRRQGALAYLVRRLPTFSPVKTPSNGISDGDSKLSFSISPSAEAVITPEPGLLMRCFAAGLQDSQMLVQRGFLDLLVTHLPLQSDLFQKHLRPEDMDLVTSAAVSAVLRRDMSLNRRLWSWFLGPEPTSTEIEDGPQSPLDAPRTNTTAVPSGQAVYFKIHGAASLERSLMVLLSRRSLDPGETARPFRICLSLMDRWEVGGVIVPKILLPALNCAYDYSLTGSEGQTAEVVRSASLFFDGVESRLIWSRLLEVLLSAFDHVHDFVASKRKLSFLQFVISRFDIKEEEMLMQHIPDILLVLYANLVQTLYKDPQVSPSFVSSVLTFAYGLLRILPKRAFNPANNTPQEVGTSHAWTVDLSKHLVDTKIKRYIGSDDGISANDLSQSLRTESMIYFLMQILKRALTEEALTVQLQVVADSLSLSLGQAPDSPAFKAADLYAAFRNVLSREPREEDSAFLIVSSIMSVITTSVARRGLAYFSQQQVLDLQAGLLQHIWLHLSPFRPKYHLEAVRLIWQMERLSHSEHRVEARLAMLVAQQSGTDSAEMAARFCVLWEHTMQSLPAKSESQGRGPSRRPSGMPLHGVAETDIDPEKVLTRPLLLLLDNLQVESTGASDVIRSWLQNLPSLDRVFHILLSRLQSDLDAYSYGAGAGFAAKSGQRHADQSLQDVVFCMKHLRNILRDPSSHTWMVLSTLQMTSSKSGGSTVTAVELLAMMCLKALALAENDASETVHHASLTVLQAILRGSSNNVLSELRIDDTLIDLLSKSLSRNVGSLQTVYLHAISAALRVKVLPASGESPVLRRRSSAAFGRASSTTERNEQLSSASPATPPAELLSCLRVGLSSVNARLYLDHWIDFLDEVLPLYADAVFASLLPLVECICQQVAVAFKYLKDIARHDRVAGSGVPISSLSALLHGLELVLGHVHHLFQGEAAKSPVAKSPETNPSFFGNMVSGVFAVEGPPTKTSRINSRLTMILSFQDAIRTCFSIWAWASQGNTNDRLDASCTATTALNALKLRNKTRRILENLFAAEELECLETLALLWSRPRPGHESESAVVFNLLLVLDGSRPKNTVPVIINALYSRTNIDALDVGRRSSLTSDLTTSEIVSFLLSYTKTIEDDATDEIWAECMIFLRDVLSNPLPHRQILPGLLEYTVLLAEKIEHTNFGDLRKMRRELGDIFLRLLTATFTARPMGTVQDTIGSRASDDIITSLLYITPRLQTVLQGSDRVLNAVDTLSRSVVGPSIHAKNFPENMTIEHLRLFEMVAQQGPTAKSWKKDMTDVFYNSRLLSSQADLVLDGWLPLLRKWALSDQARLPELLSRLTTPSTAGIMFGVGANAARLEADRRTQLTLRRAVMLLLSCEQDTFVNHLGILLNWLLELCAADASSSPSSTTRAELFMVFRALVLSFSSVHLSGAWPVINTVLQAAITSCEPGNGNRDHDTYANLALLQACKLLDLLITLEPDEFQLHEWLYITNTIDAVYRPLDQHSTALADQVAEILSADALEQSVYDTSAASAAAAAASVQDHTSGVRRPYLSIVHIDGADAKAMSRDDFVRGVLQPFLSQLSMYAYEATYQMGPPDMATCRRSLLEDVLDESTIA